MILLIDNYDSFTFNLVSYLEELGKKVVVVHNDRFSVDDFPLEEVEGVVLSPGPDLPGDSNDLLSVIGFFQGKRPILGICLGMQALALFNGAQLKRLDVPVHGKVSRIKAFGSGLFRGIPCEIDVVRYHSWVVKKLSDGFTISSETFDNQIIIVPNGTIWGDVITNVTGSDTRRVDMMFGISYTDDINKAQKALEDIVKAHKFILDSPTPIIRLHELADSSVNFVCRPWAKTDHYWDVYWDITRSVKELFDKKGISIPFPQRDVHVYHETEAKEATSL